MPNIPLPTNLALAQAAVRMLPDGECIRVAPDAVARQVADLPAARIPRVGVADWQPAGDGTYRPIVRIHECLVRVSEAERVTGVPYLTLRRLIAAGFCRGAQPSPGQVQIDLHSYYAHLEASRDPEFWTPQRRRKYSEAL